MSNGSRVKIRKKSKLLIMIISAVAVILLAITAMLIDNRSLTGKENTELVGLWRYDQYTEYEFIDGSNGGMYLDGSTYYKFTYSIKGNVLHIDFALDFITDCSYTYSVDGDKLTFVGGDGTAEVGKVYELNRVK